MGIDLIPFGCIGKYFFRTASLEFLVVARRFRYILQMELISKLNAPNRAGSSMRFAWRPAKPWTLVLKY
jgi:hypothetical protein